MAFKTIRRGCVTDDYLDDLAVVLQSIRCGTGWQRFLVFAELTKSKKKVSWIALFVYFQRKGMLFQCLEMRVWLFQLEVGMDQFLEFFDRS